MIEWIGGMIGRYIAVVLGLFILKALGWFGLGALTIGSIFAIGLAPVVLSVLFILIIIAAGLIGTIVNEAKVSRR